MLRDHHVINEVCGRHSRRASPARGKRQGERLGANLSGPQVPSRRTLTAQDGPLAAVTPQGPPGRHEQRRGGDEMRPPRVEAGGAAPMRPCAPPPSRPPRRPSPLPARRRPHAPDLPTACAGRALGPSPPESPPAGDPNVPDAACREDLVSRGGALAPRVHRRGRRKARVRGAELSPRVSPPQRTGRGAGARAGAALAALTWRRPLPVRPSVRLPADPLRGASGGPPRGAPAAHGAPGEALSRARGACVRGRSVFGHGAASCDE